MIFIMMLSFYYFSRHVSACAPPCRPGARRRCGSAGPGSLPGPLTAFSGRETCFSLKAVWMLRAESRQESRFQGYKGSRRVHAGLGATRWRARGSTAFGHLPAEGRELRGSLSGPQTCARTRLLWAVVPEAGSSLAAGCRSPGFLCHLYAFCRQKPSLRSHPPPSLELPASAHTLPVPDSAGGKTGPDSVLVEDRGP